MGVGTPWTSCTPWPPGSTCSTACIPTRNARNGLLHTSRGPRGAQERALAARPTSRPTRPATARPAGTCSLAYLRHLYVAGEAAVVVLATVHNLHFYLALMRRGAFGYHDRPLCRVACRAAAAAAPSSAGDEESVMDPKNPFMSVRAVPGHLRHLLPPAHHADAQAAEEAPGDAHQAVTKGDRVVTTGGIFGTVVEVQEDRRASCASPKTSRSRWRCRRSPVWPRTPATSNLARRASRGGRMQRKLMWRWLLIGVVTAAAVFFMFPPEKKIHLGLDLQGGIHLVLQVNTADAVRAEVDDAMERVRAELAEQGLPAGRRCSASSRGRRLQLQAGRQHRSRRSSTRSSTSACSTSRSRAASTITATLKPEVERVVKDMAVRQGLETIRNRIDQFGVAEPVIQRQGHRGRPHRRPASRRRRPGPRQGADPRHRVPRGQAGGARPRRPRRRCWPTSGGQVPDDSEVVTGDVEDWTGRVTGKEYYLRQEGLGDHRARPAQRAPLPGPVQPAGGAASRLNPGRRPQVRGVHRRRTSATAWRSSSTTRSSRRRSIRGAHLRLRASSRATSRSRSAEDLSLVLRAGALPASITYLEERTVGPSPRARLDRPRHSRRPRRAGRWSSPSCWSTTRARASTPIVALVLNAVLLIGAMAELRGHPHPARHRRHHPDHRHGGGRQRADLRAHPRGAASSARRSARRSTSGSSGRSRRSSTPT